MLTERAFIVAKFRPYVEEQRIGELVASYGLEVHSRVQFVRDSYRLKLSDPGSDADAARMAAQLEQEGEVEYAEATPY